MRPIEQMDKVFWGRVRVPVFCSLLGRPVLGLGVRLALPVEEESEWGEKATVCGYGHLVYFLSLLSKVRCDVNAAKCCLSLQ